ncbi:MAG: M20/M25/M40 family metallo-hydrolase [Flavobacteriales bacterium]|nr:M20/M25/M40 family metallo-hydrolase [Flavobacteriales bacterium]
MTDFILNYIGETEKNWKVKPKLIHGDEFHENIILVFGKKPRTAIFAHLDSIGFTVRYGNQLVKVGGPVIENNIKLVGSDSQGEIECKLKVSKKHQTFGYKFEREIERGTNLTFKPDFRETQNHVQCCYMDNRLGVWNALKVAETLEEGIIVFSTREEHGGGAVSYLGKYIQEKYGVRQALISDITWVTEGVQPGKGVAISMRDRGLPRRSYLERIINIAKETNIPFQLEVEGAGGSDGLELQSSPYPWEWVFVGAPEDNVHSPDEIVHKDDITAMTNMYKVLMEKL